MNHKREIFVLAASKSDTQFCESNAVFKMERQENMAIIDANDKECLPFLLELNPAFNEMFLVKGVEL